MTGPAAERIGQHLKRLRKEAGISQAEAGRRIAEQRGVPAWSRQAINAAERGDRAWTADDMVALAATFGVTPGSLFEPIPTCSNCFGLPLGDFTCNVCGKRTDPCCGPNGEQTDLPTNQHQREEQP